MKVKILITGLAIIGIVIGYFLTRYGFVDLSVANADSSKAMQAIFYDDAGMVAKSLEIEQGNSRTLIRKGTYSFSITQGLKNFFGSVETSGFLKSTFVEASLVEERNRTFVGNNPQSCMNYTGGHLVSWQCFEPVDNAVAHSAADKNTPSLTNTIRGFESAMINSIFPYSGKAMAFISFPSESTTGGIVHGVYPLNLEENLLEVSGGRILPDLSTEKRYGLVNYKQGALVYSFDGQELYYYANFKTAPKILSSQNTTDQPLYSVTAQGADVLRVFGDTLTPEFTKGSYIISEEGQQDSDNGEESAPGSGLARGVFEIIAGGITSSAAYESDFTQARLCSKTLICALHNSILSVYSLENGELTREYAFGGVNQIETFGESLILVTQEGVVLFNPVKNSGYYVYTFGEYEYCGLSAVDGNLLLCIDDNFGKPRSRSVLLINANMPAENEIDKQLFELSQYPEIDTLSAYKNLIFIVPDISGVPLRRDPKLGLAPDPKALADINSSIKGYVDTVGLDTIKYSIHNSLE